MYYVVCMYPRDQQHSTTPAFRLNIRYSSAEALQFFLPFENDYAGIIHLSYNVLFSNYETVPSSGEYFPATAIHSTLHDYCHPW